MFIIPNVYVDDKHLAKLLTAMAGVVIKMDMPRPVINAVVEKGEIRAITDKAAQVQSDRPNGNATISTGATK